MKVRLISCNLGVGDTEEEGRGGRRGLLVIEGKEGGREGGPGQPAIRHKTFPRWGLLPPRELTTKLLVRTASSV